MSLKTIALCITVCLVGISTAQGKLVCKDRLKHCQTYPKELCYDPLYASLLEEYCGNYCGYCNCTNWRYKCCTKNPSVRADGPHNGGCAMKLCYDVAVGDCKKIKERGECNKELNKDYCPWSCGYCIKMPAAAKLCLDRYGYGCCWDGSPAMGPHKRGCAPCVDVYPQACRQFQVKPCSNTGSYYLRTFLEKYCHESCGRCDKCRDRAGTLRCQTWEWKGYCENHYWKAYMATDCTKTCGFCRDQSGMLA